MATLIRAEFWDIGSFAPYEAAETDAILNAFQRGDDTLRLSHQYEIRDLKKLTQGEAYQINVTTHRQRPIRIAPPYKLNKNRFETIKVLTSEFELQTDTAWSHLHAAANTEISNAMESTPILRKTYISLGRKRTYAVLFDGPPPVEDSIYMVNEHNPHEPRMKIRKALTSRPHSAHATSMPSAATRFSSASSSSQAQGSSGLRRQQTTSVLRPELVARVEQAKPAEPLDTIMSFTLGGKPVAPETTAFLRTAVCEFPRPSAIMLPPNNELVEGWDRLEFGEALVEGKPLEIIFPDKNQPLGQIVLPQDLDKADSINMDDIITEVGASMGDCCICVDDLSQDAVELKQCQHRFHLSCLQKWFSTKLICPMCNIQFGKMIGRQPANGRMIYYIDNGGIAGSDKDSYIVVRFEFPEGRDTDGRSYAARREMAFLHDNGQGRILLELFKVAFRRRVMFGLGENMSSQLYKPTFNIHIKTTRKDKGMAGHGYPDDDYFSRTVDCLNANGVYFEDIFKK